MAASNLTNKIRVFADATLNKLSDSVYESDVQRSGGYQPNTVISSKVMNTVLRQTSLISVALIEALKELSNANLASPMTLGIDSSVANVKDVIKHTLLNTKPLFSGIADDVAPGTVVDDAMTARKFLAGWQISQEFKKKLNFKGGWVGTHQNNDILYYGTAGLHKGFYIVKDLANESVNEETGVVTPAGELTITSGQTPTTSAIASNLHRLTIESNIGADTSLSKTITISNASTDNQLPSAKAVYHLMEDVQGGMDNHSGRTDNPHSVTKEQVGLGNLENSLQLKASDKTTVIDISSTHTQIPSAKAVYEAFDFILGELGMHTADKTNPHAVNKTQVGLSAVTNHKQLRDSDKTTTINNNSTDTEIPSAKAVYTAVEGKVAKDGNKVLSDNNFTTALKNKLEGMDAGAEKNRQLVLINTLSNGNTILLSQLTPYDFIYLKLVRKPSSTAKLNLFGDTKIITPDVFTAYSFTNKSWVLTGMQTGPFAVDITAELQTAENIGNYLNNEYPPSGYSLGAKAKVFNGIADIYATVQNVSTTYYSGIKMITFNNTTIDYATFAPMTAVTLKLTCNSNFQLEIYGLV